jgi:hypothetical protein
MDSRFTVISLSLFVDKEINSFIKAEIINKIFLDEGGWDYLK